MRLMAHGPVFRMLLAVCFVGSGIGGSGMARGAHELSVSAGPMYEAWPPEDSALACCVLVQAPSEVDSRRRPIQVALALDVSRESSGPPLKAMKDAAKVVVNALANGDQLAIVAFSDFGRCVFSMQQLNAGSRKTATGAIDALREETGRSIAAGLEKARTELTRLKSSTVAGRYLFLLTIGDATKGTRGPEELLAEAAALHDNQGIAVSTFGLSTFGTFGAKVDFNEDLLQEMALANGGRYYFVEEPEQTSAMVGRETERIAEASAREVTITLDTQSDAVVTNVAGARHEENRLVLGDMRPGQRQMVVFDLVNRPRRERDIILTTTYIEPGGSTQRRDRSYMRIPLTSGSPRLHNVFGPYLAVYDLQEDLALAADRIEENRRDYLTMYRTRLTRLEQENATMRSDHVTEQLEYFREFERDLDDTAIEAERLIKHTKFRLQQLLYGLE